MKTCDKCQSTMPDEAKFCGNCGGVLAALPVQPAQKSEGSYFDKFEQFGINGDKYSELVNLGVTPLLKEGGKLKVIATEDNLREAAKLLGNCPIDMFELLLEGRDRHVEALSVFEGVAGLDLGTSDRYTKEVFYHLSKLPSLKRLEMRFIGGERLSRRFAPEDFLFLSKCMRLELLKLPSEYSWGDKQNEYLAVVKKLQAALPDCIITTR